MNIPVKTSLAVVASLAVNIALLGTLDWSVHQAQVAPNGVVEVTQLPDEAVLAAYAQAEQSAAGTVATL